MELSLSVDVGSVICIWQRGVEGSNYVCGCHSGVWEPHFGALDSRLQVHGATVRDLELASYHNLFGHHVPRGSAHVFRLSKAAITNCPRPRRLLEGVLLDHLWFPLHSPKCCMNFHRQRQLISDASRWAGLQTADQICDCLAKMETCQYYRGQWSLALIRSASNSPT